MSIQKWDNVTDKNVPNWSFEGTYTSKITDVYDGDTVHAVIKIHGKLTKLHVRMLGYDAPEMRSKDATLKEQAMDARNYLRSRILNQVVTLKCGKFDKYGRVLGDIYIGKTHINEDMAKKYGIYGREEYNKF
jgi:endonuclease YncB( thermonuclease family)